MTPFPACPRADHLLVKIDPHGLDRTESGLYIPDWQPGDKDATKAEVVAVPLALSPDRPLPFPDLDGRRYFFSDLCDLPKVGQTVYLRPNTFKPELEYPGHPGVFVVPLDKAVAVGASVEDGGPVVPFQGLLLGHEVWDDDVRVRKDGVRERYRRLSLVANDGHEVFANDIVEEVNPLPVPFAVEVSYVGVPLRGQESVVMPYDVVLAHRMLYAHHRVVQDDITDDTTPERRMWQPPKIAINGTDYVVIPRQMIMAKLQ